MKQAPRSVASLVLAVFLSCSAVAWSQKPEARLLGGISGDVRAVLPGSRSPHADRGQDMGAVSPEMVVPGITLVFKRSPAQQQALEELLAAQQNPASALYHQWLTPDVFAARFGMAASDIAATQTWVQSHGFHIDNAARDRITFSGTAAQVHSAFGADLHHYQVEGERHFAPASDLTLPAELAPMTAAVLHLSDFRPKPSVVAQTPSQPQFTSVSTQAHYLTPFDVLTMYDMAPNGVQKFQGSGQSIAVMGQSYVNTGFTSEVVQFQSLATSGAQRPTAVLVPGSGVEAISPGDQGESELDLEYASGMAPKANVSLVYVGANPNYSVFDSIDFAITTNLAPVVSISYGACESLLSATELDQDNALFQQAAAQGQTIVAASGDNGSTACAPYSTSSGVSVAQQQALAVSFPASSPYVTAVGGTQMQDGTFTAGVNSYWSTASGLDLAHSLLSYVPETVWNEGSATRGIIASGGGTSGFFTRPSWQSGVPGIISGTNRLLPDVSLLSSIRAPGFLLCSSDRSLSGSQTSCSSGLLGSNGTYTVAGGTSFATPILAGMIADLNQAEQSTGQGNINPTFYTLASNPVIYANVFHDITSGTNACPAGAVNCAAAGLSVYAAAPGYDEATGLGSFDFGKLTAVWPASGTLTRTGTAVTVGSLPYTGTAGSVLPLSIDVSWTGPVTDIGPSGTVAISVDGTVVQPSVALALAYAAPSSAEYNFTVPATAGSHILSATYLGDANYAPSAGTGSILVGNLLPSGTFTLAANNLTVASGGTSTDQVTITPASGYSGRLTWSLSAASGTSGTSSLTACYGIGSPAVNGASTATLTIGVGTACGSTSSSGSVRTMVSRTAPPGDERPWWKATRMGVCAGLLAFGLLGLRRKKGGVPNLLAAVLFTIVAAGLAGCGGSNANGITPTPPPVTAATVYTLTLKGTDSVNTSITASTTFTLTVN